MGKMRCPRPGEVCPYRLNISLDCSLEFCQLNFDEIKELLRDKRGERRRVLEPIRPEVLSRVN